MTSTELLPTQFWGLDPVFRTHAKLYIKDIVTLQEIEGFPGVFRFGSHPIARVDVQGVVVRVDERSRFFSYALDDSTGVVNCTHWKPDEGFQQPEAANHGSLPEALSGKWTEVLKQKSTSQNGYMLGDLLHVRGKLKRFRENVEVMASYCVRLSDPNKETERMLQLPSLYTECYNQPATLPRALRAAGPGENIQQRCDDYEVETAVRNHLESQLVETFSREDILRDGGVSSLLNNCSQKEALLTKVLLDMEKSGDIFRACHPGDQLLTYKVTCRCKELKEELIRIIQRWINMKGDEEGCSDVYLHDQLRRLVAYRQIERSAINQCLDSLEANSDIISTAHRRYIVFNDL